MLIRGFACISAVRIAHGQRSAPPSRVEDARANTISFPGKTWCLGATRNRPTSWPPGTARCEFEGKLIAADVLRELADFEPVHLELQRAEGNPERSRRRGNVPARFLERADQEIALEGRHRPLEQVFSRRSFRIQLGY